MRHFAPLALALTACQEPSPPPALPPSTSEERPSSSPSQLGAQAAPPVRDGWSQIVDRLGDLDGGARGSQVKTALDARTRDRKMEDQQIDGAMVALQTQLIRSCEAGEARKAFSALQSAETLSLSSDRGLLSQLLELAGADGRAKIWGAGEVDSVLGRPREVMIARAQSTLPLWLASGDDEAERLEAQRLVLTLNLESEAAAIRTRAELSAFGNVVVAMQPTAIDTPANVAVALEKVDAKLLVEQSTRFEALLDACEKIEPQQWLFLVAGGAASSYLGSLGGTNGMGDPNDRRVTTMNALSSGMGMSSGGASPQSGQLGGGAPGTLQSGQLGGSQLGGNQPGGGQPGGANMSGQTPGGSPGAPGTGFPGVQAGGPGAASSTLPSTGGAAGPPTGGNANPR